MNARRFITNRFFTRPMLAGGIALFLTIALGFAPASPARAQEGAGTPDLGLVSDAPAAEPARGNLTPSRSRHYRAPGIVDITVTPLPSGTYFEKGSTLRLVVQGGDLAPNPVLVHGAGVNKGPHTLYTGGQYDANLLIPVVGK